MSYAARSTVTANESAVTRSGRIGREAVLHVHRAQLLRQRERAAGWLMASIGRPGKS